MIPLETRQNNCACGWMWLMPASAVYAAWLATVRSMSLDWRRCGLYRD
ncbi:MAG: hypothetical protein LBL93_01865 [Ruminococcus sp.]|nr:hypothetical protein [Ruminococcus sp.]